MNDAIVQFQQQYACDEDCISLVYRLKWPTGFQCKICGNTAAYTINSRRLPLYECRNCGHQSSLTAGTVMDKSRTPLHKWILTMCIMSVTDRGINAVRLSRLIGVTYKTAWSMLSKLRRTISDMDRTVLLSGEVEANSDIYMMQSDPTPEAREMEKSVIVARSVNPNEPSYAKIKLVTCRQDPRDLLTREAEQQFKSAHISRSTARFEINRWPILSFFADSPLQLIARYAFMWINITFHGLRPASAQSYLDEYCFRHNMKQQPAICPFEHLLRHSLINTKQMLSSNDKLPQKLSA